MNKKVKCEFCDKMFSSVQSKCNHVNITHSELKIKQIDNKCPNCNKIFSNRCSLNRHKRTICKNSKKQLFEKKEEKNNVKNINNNNCHNTTNNSTVNNQNKTIINVQNNMITINPYNNPNTDNLTLLDICDIFEKEFQMILKLIERIYFNKQIEENHTFNVSNMNGEYVNVLENNEVGIQLKKYFFDELFTISLDKVKLLYKKYKNKLFEEPKQKEIKEKIKALEEIRTENGSIYKKYIKLMNILAYNNKDVVNNTWKKNHRMDNVEITWDDKVSIDEIAF